MDVNGKSCMAAHRWLWLSVSRNYRKDRNGHGRGISLHRHRVDNACQRCNAVNAAIIGSAPPYYGTDYFSKLSSIRFIGLSLYAGAIGNESVPKLKINDTVIFLTSVSILVISNHNSFWVVFDKIASVYFI